ncbi:MAG: hypothetical protein ABJA35_11945 [Parafilimonas sp.]
MADRSSKNIDLQESTRDKKELKQEKVTLDLPDVKDIPGQENIKIPDFKEMADTTISSDDEEGVGLFEDENGDDATSERISLATEIDEDDLIIKDENLDNELDEEDENNFDEDDDLEITDDSVSKDSDVSEGEKIALQRTATDMDTEDNEDLYAAQLDDTDFDGEKLNEDDDDVSGKDLDVPGEELDDADEAIGEEDEENNDYSLGDTK